MRELVTLMRSEKLPVSGADCPQVRPRPVLRHGEGLYLVGEVAAVGAPMIDIRCGRCGRHGRLTVQRVLTQ